MDKEEIIVHEVAIFYSTGGSDLILIENMEFDVLKKLVNYDLSKNAIINLKYREDKHDFSVKRVKRDTEENGETGTHQENINITTKNESQFDFYGNPIGHSYNNTLLLIINLMNVARIQERKTMKVYIYDEKTNGI